MLRLPSVLSRGAALALLACLAARVSLGAPSRASTIGAPARVAAPTLGADELVHPLDYEPARIAWGGHVRIASNGTDALVLWANEYYAYAARFSASGALLDPEPIRLGDGHVFDPRGDVVWDGTSYLYSSMLATAHIDPATGDVTTGPAIPGTIAPDVRLAAGGGTVLAVSSNGGPLRATLVDVAGNAIATDVVIASSATIGAYRAAWSNGHYLVAYTDGTTLDAVEISPAGALEQASPIVLTSTLPSSSSSSAPPPAIGVSGSDDGFLVAWPDARGPRALYGARVGVNGVNADPSGRLLTTGRALANVAWNGTTWLLEWEDDSSAATISAATIAKDGTIGPTMPVGTSRAAVNQDGRSAVVATPGAVFVAYGAQTEPALDAMTIYAQRLDAKGKLLDPQRALVSSQMVSEYGVSVVATANGNEYLAQVGKRLVRLGVDGTPIDGTLATTDLNLIGAVGTGYMLGVDVSDAIEIGTYSPTAGLGTPRRITVKVAAGERVEEVFGACASDRCLIVWSESDRRIAGMIVDAYGSPITGEIALPPYADVVRIGSDGASFLLVTERGPGRAHDHERPRRRDGDAERDSARLDAVGDGVGERRLCAGEHVRRGPPRTAGGSPRTSAAPYLDLSSLNAMGDGFLAIIMTSDAGVGLDAIEIPATGPVTAAETPLFPTATPIAYGSHTGLASASPGNGLAVAFAPTGKYGTPRARRRVLQWAVPPAVDGGAPDGGGASTDDGGASTDGGGIADAGPPPAPWIDAGGSPSPGVDASANGGEYDGRPIDTTATVSGCGCLVGARGARGSIATTAMLGVLALLGIRRRRARVRAVT